MPPLSSYKSEPGGKPQEAIKAKNTSKACDMLLAPFYADGDALAQSI